MDAFFDQMISAPSVEEAMRVRFSEAEPVPQPRALRVLLPVDLRHVMMPDLPHNVTLEPGRLEIRAGTAVEMLERLVALAMITTNDLDRFRAAGGYVRPKLAMRRYAVCQAPCAKHQRVC